MNDATSQTIYFYNRHPISYDIILANSPRSCTLHFLFSALFQLQRRANTR